MVKIYLVKKPNFENDEYLEYNTSINFRICKKHFKLINKFSSNNNAYFIRQLLKSALNNEFYYKFDKSDFEKVIKVFSDEDIKQIKERRFKQKKEHKITVRLFKEDKERLKFKSKNNISRYVEDLLNGFILNIVYEVEPFI